MWFRFLLLTILFLCSCATIPKHINTWQTINLVVHVRSKNDIKTLLPIIKNTNNILQNSKIKINVIKILYDVPRLTINNQPVPKDFKQSIDSPKNVHVFFVNKLWKNNVVAAHVHYSALRCKDFILLTDKQKYSSLAHELGHMFGLMHNKIKNNIMNQDRINERKSKLNYEQIDIIKNNIQKREKMCNWVE